MNYKNIIENFTWSYSRITQYESCPYGFLLKYIFQEPPANDYTFFADFGSFVHELLERFNKGELKGYDLVREYMDKFHIEVTGKPMSQDIADRYYWQGFDYFVSLMDEVPDPDTVWVEKKVWFKVGDKKFMGIIDKLVGTPEKGFTLVDNKSHDLKERTGKVPPRATDKELDEYLRQLYLYCIPIKRDFHIYPKYLQFNCYRTQKVITEPFSMKAFEEAKLWALNTIAKIEEEVQWAPNLDKFKCRHLCNFADSCEYYNLFK